MTPQRLAILETVVRLESHPNAEEVHHLLHQRFPSLSLTTVYRTLETFEKAGEIRRVSLGDGRLRYDARTASHHHVICRECGYVRDFEPVGDCIQHCPPNIISEFQISEFTMVFRGICRECRGESTPIRKD